MSKVLKFSRTDGSQQGTPFKKAVRSIENRFGVSFKEYVGVNGKRSAETHATMLKALQKETFHIKS